MIRVTRLNGGEEVWLVTRRIISLSPREGGGGGGSRITFDLGSKPDYIDVVEDVASLVRTIEDQEARAAKN